MHADCGCCLLIADLLPFPIADACAEPSSKKIQLIGEIQIRQKELLDASKDDHKLYEILRVDTMNEMLGRSGETAQWNIFQEEELGEEQGAAVADALGDRGRGLLVDERPKQVSVRA